MGIAGVLSLKDALAMSYVFMADIYAKILRWGGFCVDFAGRKHSNKSVIGVLIR